MTDETARYYRERAKEYDTTSGYEDPIAEALREPLKKRYQELLRDHDVLEIACGTGYWTAVVARTARSILATDASEEMLVIARKRLAPLDIVRCQVADAYSLAGVRGRFTAAFAHWWWSHIPQSRIPDFLKALREALEPGTLVVLGDQLRYEHPHRRVSPEGDLLEPRELTGRKTFEIVKNFPSPEELKDKLNALTDSVSFEKLVEQGTWIATFRLSR